MTPYIVNTHPYTLGYCKCLIAYNKTKWWEFERRKELRDCMNCYLPLMVVEMDIFDKIETC